MIKWQPIETAPKDGTKILLFQPADKQDELSIETGEWEDYAYKKWYKVGVDMKKLRTVNGGYWVCSYIFNPTHWMPLPDPPFAVP